jgi:hypothetical protein
MPTVDFVEGEESPYIQGCGSLGYLVEIVFYKIIVRMVPCFGP